MAWPKHHQLPLLTFPGSLPPSTLMPTPREVLSVPHRQPWEWSYRPTGGKMARSGPGQERPLLARLWNSQPFPSVFLVPGTGMRHAERGQDRASGRKQFLAGKGGGMATGTLALSFQRWVRGEQSCLGGRDPLWGSVRMGPRWAKGQGGLCGETPSLSVRMVSCPPPSPRAWPPPSPGASTFFSVSPPACRLGSEDCGGGDWVLLHSRR